MPTTYTITKTLYTYEELSEDAKERARDWYKQGAFDYEWWDSAYEDIKEIAEILGIEFEVREKRGISLFFDGFYHQGEGSSFYGRYRYNLRSVRKMTRHVKGWKHAQPERLIRIAQNLLDIQKKNRYQLTATIKSKGDNWIGVDVEWDYSKELKEEDEQGIIDALRDFNGWIFDYLKSEWEGIREDEPVADTIIANEYTFDEEGNRED